MKPALVLFYVLVVVARCHCQTASGNQLDIKDNKIHLIDSDGSKIKVLDEDQQRN